MPHLATSEMTATRVVDRRVGRRARPTYNTVFRLQSPSGRMTDGLVWDLSTGGVGLLLPFAPAVGTAFEGELRSEDGRTAAVPATFRVAHVRRLYTGDYFVGGKFLAELSDAALDRFALPQPAETPAPAAPDADMQSAGTPWRK